MSRANTIRRERSTEYGDDPNMLALVPFWDMANHTEGEITTCYNPINRNVESRAISDLAVGDQILIHYSDRPNFDFLNHNGYVVKLL